MQACGLVEGLEDLREVFIANLAVIEVYHIEWHEKFLLQDSNN